MAVAISIKVVGVAVINMSRAVVLHSSGPKLVVEAPPTPHRLETLCAPENGTTGGNLEGGGLVANAVVRVVAVWKEVISCREPPTWFADGEDPRSSSGDMPRALSRDLFMR